MSNSDQESVTEVVGDSFWEVGNYKRTVKRIDNGYQLCIDLIKCIHERARIEKLYSLQLSEWATRWRQSIGKGSQNGTLEQSWTSLMTEAEKVSNFHMEMKTSLVTQDIAKVKKWQEENYHKPLIGGFRETKEAEDSFRKAQKPWAKKFQKVALAKKAYYSACNDEKVAFSKVSMQLATMSPEALAKLQDNIEKCQQEKEKKKDRYQNSLTELGMLTSQYIDNMKQVFEQCQQFEGRRIHLFKEVLLDVKGHLDLSANRNFQNIYQTLEDAIQSVNVEEDLMLFQSNYGPGMPMRWPQFEEWPESLNKQEGQEQEPHLDQTEELM